MLLFMRTLIAIVVTSATLLLSASSARAESSKTPMIRLTEAQGQVFKRGFIDWQRELWSDPVPASEGDLLHEGMQIGTGDKSWAQVTWPNVTTRAWSNSVYAIAPNQRLVYLLGGEMLYQLDKHRRGKGNYCVWTKLVQARMRGTTVLFQTAGNLTRVTVLEGCAEILNRLDRSTIKISPGVIVEITDKRPPDSASAETAKGKGGQSEEKLLPVSGKASADILFDTKDTQTTIIKADTTSLLNHPLVTELATPLTSLHLVKDTLGAAADTTILNSRTTEMVEIVSVPRKAAYRAGPLVGSVIALPAAQIIDFPPSGTLATAGSIAEQTGALDPASALEQGLPRSASFGNVPTVSPSAPSVMPSTGSVGSDIQSTRSALPPLLDTSGLSTSIHSILH